MNVLSARLLVFCVLVVAGHPGKSAELADIRVSGTFDVSPEAAWATWTTVEGLQSFLAPRAEVDLRVDGTFSALFFPGNPPGERGAEGMRIVALEPPDRLLITWDSPVEFGPIREQRALVEVRVEPVGEESTRISLRHFGWGDGEGWSDVRTYFVGAWRIVFDRLQRSYAEGPIDWSQR